MNRSISTAVRIFSVASAGIPLAAASAQLAPASAQQIGVISTPQGQKIPVFGEGQLPFSFLHSMEHNRMGTPAQRAAEAAVEAVKSQKWQADIARGEALMKAGDLDGAVAAFQQMITYDPNDGLAYRRMAEAYAAAGKLPEASRAFHKFLVEGFGPGTNGGVGDDASEWAEYALVLVKTGQPAEAVRCYNHAASLLDFEDSENHGGKPFLKVLLPELAAEPTSPEQVQYTPERLQALADTALAHEEKGFGSFKEALAHMKEATKLYPNSAVTHYYLGEAFPSRTPEQKAAYQKAAELGDDRTAAAAKGRLAVFR